MIISEEFLNKTFTELRTKLHGKQLFKNTLEKYYQNIYQVNMKNSRNIFHNILEISSNDLK